MRLMMVSTVLLLCGCTQVMVSRTGPRYAAKPADCEIVWENLEMAEVAVKYQTIGVVSLGGWSQKDVDTDRGLRERVRVEGCKAGADAALVGMNAGHAFGRGAAVWLLKKRDKPPVWASSPFLGGASAAPAEK
jgi:hypothetical protein